MSDQTGWICPKCGRVYAPWVKECEACAPMKTAPVVEPWSPYYPYPWYPSPCPTGPCDPPFYPPAVTWGNNSGNISFGTLQ